MHDDRAYAAVVAVFATVLYAAMVIATFGIISLATDTEVIQDSTVGPLVGPVMTAAAVAAVLVILVSIGTAVPADQQRISPLTIILAGVSAYGAFGAAGGIAVAIGSPEPPLRAFLFALGQCASVYAGVVGVLGCVIALLYQIVLVGRFRQRGMPHWPWENDEED